ncbi:hypothetical protein [Bacillus safensis]|uniref:hypothetical protein n=1 Tax=Bacillus safensis TaxID=561879 RepID=UPI0021E5EAC4|nr:hypothetical protein [Bacillus safensis]UXO88727.1 hypothetical protein N7921_03215 [Bacillus safensis]
MNLILQTIQHIAGKEAILVVESKAKLINGQEGAIYAVLNDESQSNKPTLYIFKEGQFVLVSGSLADDAELSFLDLIDTPASYEGFANKWIKINPSGTGLIFADVPQGGGSGGDASTVVFTPTESIESDNVQMAIEELDFKKAPLDSPLFEGNVHLPETTAIGNVKPKEIAYLQGLTGNIENRLKASAENIETVNTSIDKLETKSHSHSNKQVIDKFSEQNGSLMYGSSKVASGDMQRSIYDADGDDIVDFAKSLSRQVVSIDEINSLLGVTGNIQDQINGITTGVQFKGEFDTYSAAMQAFPSPQRGYWIFIKSDSNHSGSKTQYIYSGDVWVYAGGASSINDATSTVKGGITLSGDLTGTASLPQLAKNGVEAGTYLNPTVTVDEKGRVSSIANGQATAINDNNVDKVSTWSSDKINESLNFKANTNHTHTNLHDPALLGTVLVDESSIGNNKVLAYNEGTERLNYVPVESSSVFVGMKKITGNYELIAGGYTKLAVDETGKKITITSINSGGIKYRYESLPNDRSIPTKLFNIPEYENNNDTMMVYKNGVLQSKQMDYIEKSNKSIEFIKEISVEDHIVFIAMSGGRGGVPTLSEINETVELLPSETKTFSLDVWFDKYDIRTVYAKDENKNLISVSVFDKSSNGDIVYQSLKSDSIYDIANIPCQDKDGTQKIHVQLINHSQNNAQVTLKIKTTNLL